MKPNEIKSRECFVALFDILGFSDICNDNDPQKLYTFIRRLLNIEKYSSNPEWCRNNIEGEVTPEKLDNLKHPQLPEYGLNRLVFSDTILYFTKDTSFDSFFDLLIASTDITQIFALHTFPLRGAISCGDVLFDEQNNILLGKAIVNAHEAESSQKWMGTIIDNHCKNYIERHNYLEKINERINLHAADITEPDKKNKYLNIKNIITNYSNSFFKEKKILDNGSYFVLNWLYNGVYTNKDKLEFNTSQNTCKSITENYLEYLYSDVFKINDKKSDEIKKKCQNTLEFILYLLDINKIATNPFTNNDQCK